MLKLSFNQKAIVVGLILGIFYTGAYIYNQHRLTIDYRDSIKKWCIGINKHGYFGYGKESIDNCIKYF